MRLVYLIGGWVTGLIVVANGAALPAWGWGLLVLMCTIAAGLTWRFPTYRLYNLVLLALCLGGLRYTFVPQTSEIAALNNSGGLTITGTVTADPDIRDDRTQLRVTVDEVQQGGFFYDLGGDVLAYVPRITDVDYGDRVRVTGALIQPGEYDTFSYADYLAQRGIFSIMENTSVEVLEPASGVSVFRPLYDLRRDLGRAIGGVLPEPQAGLLTGILLGNERGISPALNDDFKRTGAAHVIAISGFNMAIIAGLVMALLARAQIRGWWRVMLGLLAIMVYTVFTGANPAVVRAAVMSCVLIVGTEGFRRKTYVPASLAFVAFLMSVVEPNVLWSISFQLSFFAVLGLALFVEPLQRRFDALLYRLFPPGWASSVGGFLSEPLIVTVAANLTTLPLTLLYFERLSIVSLSVNLLIVPVQTYLLLIGGLATLLVLIVPPLAQVLFWLAYVMLSWTIFIVRTFADVPWADVEFRAAPAMIYAYFGLLILWAVLMATKPVWWLRIERFTRSRPVVTSVFVGAGALLVLIGLSVSSRPDDRLHVWFLDVGHSNGVLVQTPGGAHILVDGGRFPSRLLTAVGDRLPFSDRQIDVIAISQPDEFDYAALPALLRRYDTGVVLTNGQPNLSAAYEDLQVALTEHEVIEVTAGYTLDFDDGTRLEVLYPDRTPDLTTSINQAPLVLRLSYGDISFLLPSDLSAEGQARMLASGAWPLASVLMLPDHGTARSLETNFLDAVQPSLVVVQADSANRRGDPNPDTLALLPEGVPVLRTDETGVVHLWTDGSTLWRYDD